MYGVEGSNTFVTLHNKGAVKLQNSFFMFYTFLKRPQSHMSNDT